MRKTYEHAQAMDGRNLSGQLFSLPLPLFRRCIAYCHSIVAAAALSVMVKYIDSHHNIFPRRQDRFSISRNIQHGPPIATC